MKKAQYDQRRKLSTSADYKNTRNNRKRMRQLGRSVDQEHRVTQTAMVARFGEDL